MNDKPDQLAKLQREATRARDIALQIESLEENLKSLRSTLHTLHFETIPALMDETGLDIIGVPAEGNRPGLDFAVRPFFSASIASSWPQEKRAEAFETLKKYEAEDLIKTEVIAKLPKGKMEVAKQLVQAAEKLHVTADLRLSVHPATLTAWLREIYDGGQSIPTGDLDKLGAFVGRCVKPVERKLKRQ